MQPKHDVAADVRGEYVRVKFGDRIDRAKKRKELYVLLHRVARWAAVGVPSDKAPQATHSCGNKRCLRLECTFPFFLLFWSTQALSEVNPRPVAKDSNCMAGIVLYGNAEPPPESLANNDFDKLDELPCSYSVFAEHLPSRMEKGGAMRSTPRGKAGAKQLEVGEGVYGENLEALAL